MKYFNISNMVKSNIHGSVKTTRCWTRWKLLDYNLLRDDCEDISQVEFSDAGEKALTKVKEMIKVDHDGYDDSEWLEALGSLLYLRKRSNESKETVIEDLESRKEHLKNRGLNSKAYDVLQNSGLT